MNEEIKEILESSRKIIKSNRENGFDRIIMLGDDIDKLLDYITNLQEENQKLKETINKTVEYIKEWQSFPHTNCTTHKELKNLSNILKGDEIK